jgi:hypothetical protein
MYFIGLDLGQRRDFSAIAVIQRQDRMAVSSPNPTCVSAGVPDFSTCQTLACSILTEPALPGGKINGGAYPHSVGPSGGMS